MQPLILDAPAGVPINIGVAGPNSTSAADTIKNFTVTLTANETYVAIANGVLNPNTFATNPDGRNTAFTLFVKAMAREMGTTSDVDFFVLHGSSDAPTVDVLARGVATVVNDAAYGDMTDYIKVPAAAYILDVTPGDANSTIVASFGADLSGLGGGAAVVFASGFLTPGNNQNAPAFGIFAALPDGNVVAFPQVQLARLQVIHNAADIAAASVDIYLNGTMLLDNFAFRSATPFIDAPAGVEINIGVAPGNSTSASDTLKNFAVTLDNGATYIAVANGVLDPNSYAANPEGKNTAFTLFIKTMARETGTSSNDVEFTVLHGSSDAPTVDIIARGVATLVNDAAYGDITDYITVPAATYTLDLTLSDGTTLVQSYIADLSGLGGGSAAVFASGFLTPGNNQNGESFGIFFALADGTVGEFPTGVTSVEETSSVIPTEYDLSQNFPNPFNPSTTINFAIPNNEFVTLKIFNILGSEVATLVNGTLAAGSYKFNFDAQNLASGVYLYELKAGNFTEIKKMNLLK